MRMDPLLIIVKYYAPGSVSFRVLIEHSRLVMEKAVELAGAVSASRPDIEFIREAAMLHDIGIRFAQAPEIGCHGDMPYVCHGYLGRNLLEEEGLPAHALVCERHVGAGISRSEILERRLPLPPRDMLPVSLEEKIICLADKFFSKGREGQAVEKSLDEILSAAGMYGSESLKRLREILSLFSR